ncbi:glycosyltransferase family 9 protein [Flavobacterium pallidum]|uniref:Glycosyltransferase n=1 Tax=Flavobacterium pallidum TaxID=2172098 RepID=A0A2S1SI33_9FLAO|nr:glycosyltransferase family 9 protein [Flavobacterium pallidum]AWI26060.1 glycosyltransferase [Flavobacterium pallidum]
MAQQLSNSATQQLQKKFLVIQQKMIGDVLATSIICNNLRQRYPEAQVDYLVYPFTQAVILNNPNIDNVILFDDKYRKSKMALFRFAMHLRKQKYDVVIDAYGKTESNLIVLFSGAKVKLGFYKKYTRFLYTDTVKEIPAPLTNAGTALENRINLLNLLKPSTAAADIKPKIWLTDAEIENGKAILKRHHINMADNIIMIGALGSGNNKTYPFPFMAKLLDYMVKKTGATLLFNYMPSQTQQAKTIYGLCLPETQQKIRLDVVPGSIREFLSITYHCKALIGNEGGAVNMAKAINIPTFTIFSTWIKKEAWSSFEDGKINVSVHLKDFKPELYGEKSPKDMKKQAMELYQEYSPELIIPVLDKYLSGF